MPTLTINVDSATYRYLTAKADANAERGKGPVTVEGVASDRLAYAASREAALAKHKNKVTAARISGPDSGVTFARRTPLLPDRAFTAPETERDVARWAEHAPRGERVRRVRRAPTPTAEPTAEPTATAATGEV